MPVMGIDRSVLPIRQHLFSKTRRGLLELLYGHTDKEYYINQMMQILDSGSGAVQRELKLMTEAGLLNRTKRGNLVYYQANGKCPIFAELKSLANKGIFSLPGVSKSPSAANNQSLKHKHNIKIPRGKITGFCQRHHIKKLSLFGAALRDDSGPDSDVDILVEFLPGHTPGYFGLLDMKTELSDLLGGRKADIRISRDLSRYFKGRVVSEVSVLYEAA